MDVGLTVLLFGSWHFTVSV